MNRSLLRMKAGWQPLVVALFTCAMSCGSQKEQGEQKELTQRERSNRALVTGGELKNTARSAAPLGTNVVAPFGAQAYEGISGECDAILRFGVYDENNAYSTRERYRLTQMAACSSTYDTLAKAKAAAGAGAIDIFGLIGIGAAATYTEESYQTALSKFCGQGYEKAAGNDLLVTQVRQASAVIASAWKGCIDSVHNGFVYYVKPSVDRQRFSVVVQNKSDGVTAFRVDKITFTPPLRSDSCQGLPMSLPFQSDKNYLTFSCVKEATAAILVGVETDRGFMSPIEVPSRTEVPLSLEERLANMDGQISGLLPVGSIIPYNGTKESVKALASLGWVLCDGTPITDEHSPFKGQNTPNLTGRFLMGSKDGRVGMGKGAETQDVGPLDVTTSTTGQWDNAASVKGNPVTVLCGGLTECIGHPIYATGKTSSESISILPPFFSILYLMKIR